MACYELQVCRTLYRIDTNIPNPGDIERAEPKHTSIFWAGGLLVSERDWEEGEGGFWEVLGELLRAGWMVFVISTLKQESAAFVAGSLLSFVLAARSATRAREAPRSPPRIPSS